MLTDVAKLAMANAFSKLKNSTLAPGVYSVEETVSLKISGVIKKNDDEEYIQVGVFIGDDLYGVGTYNKNTKVFSIDEDEIANSIYTYIEENQ